MSKSNRLDKYNREAIDVCRFLKEARTAVWGFE